MYRIFITPEIKGYAQSFADNLFSNRGPRFGYPIKRLADFKKKFSCANPFFEIRAKYYIQEIINCYKDLLISLPSKFDDWQLLFENIISKEELETPVTYKKKVWVFYECVTYCMRYEDAKFELYPYIGYMDIHSCVYCNYNPATMGRDGSSNYTIDHFRCQSKYPYLCTSFFNLYPCCSTCNSNKGDDDYLDYFELYIENDDNEPEKNPYLFLTNCAILRYYYEKKIDNIRIFVTSPHNYGMNVLNKEKINVGNWYDTIDCYRYLKKIMDIALENSEVQLKVTSWTFKKLNNINKSELLNIFLRKSIEEKNIHQEPLNKLTIDFGKEIGLL